MAKSISFEQQEALTGGRAERVGEQNFYNGVPFLSIDVPAPQAEFKNLNGWSTSGTAIPNAYGAPLVI